MKQLLVFLIFLSVRLLSVFVVQTYFVPDEYWQSLEISHKIVFGYGYETWEWKNGIRSYIYPIIFAGLYKILQLLNLDTVNLLIITPRILQSLISAISDYRFYIWSGKSKWAVFLMSINYFWFYCGSRTLTNTLEASLTVIGLSYYPWQYERSTYLWFALLCCFVRPTAAVIWIPLIFYHLKNSKTTLVKFILSKILITSIIFSICVGIDSYLYGRLIITPFEFFKLNFLKEIGSFYGTHSWSWYFTVGLPVVLGINTIPFLIATIETLKNRKVYPIRKKLLLIILFALSSLSLVEHKEFRFILILIPMCLYITSDSLSRWSRKASKFVIWVVAITLLIGNLLPAWYLSTIYKKGPVDTIKYISKIAKEYKGENNQKASILFLMPCHSTPFYSHVHENITMRFLKCEPNLEQKSNYVDEADQFYDNPNNWLRFNLPVYPKSALPSHIVLFEPLSTKITDFLMNYEVIHRVPHADYVNDRIGKHIFIYQRYLDKEKDEDNYNEFNVVKNEVR